MKKRVFSLLLAAILVVMTVMPAAAYEVPGQYDETFYATLDSYGALVKGSVVKSYRLGDSRTVTDYGVYDRVVNLTDRSVPAISDGKVVFTAEDSADGKFYFQGDTAKPFETLPWKLAVSYRLNGAPIRAEELAGKTGLVEILLDVTPNEKANTYGKNNLVLTAATAFSDDDITSLEAPGAEVQLVGNLRTVLFMVLPGEEQHFSIRVGADAFESAGLIFLAVPATLEQLEQVADLRELKDEAEKDFDDIDLSLADFLDSFEGMNDSLKATADGLDALNSVRGSMSAGKGGVYTSADAALSDLDALAAALGGMDQYLDTADSAVSEVKDALDTAADSMLALRPVVEEGKTLIKQTQGDVAALQALLKDAESLNTPENRGKLTAVTNDLAEVEKRLPGLSRELNDLQRHLLRMEELSAVKTEELTGAIVLQLNDDGTFRILEKKSGKDDPNYAKQMTLQELQENLANAQKVAAAYEQTVKDTIRQKIEEQVKVIAPEKVQEAVAAQTAAAGRELTAEEIAAITQQVTAQVTEQVKGPVTEAVTKELTLPVFLLKAGLAKNEEEAAALTAKLRQAQQLAEAHAQELDQLQQGLNVVNATLPLVNRRIREVNDLLYSIAQPTADMLNELKWICNTVTEKKLAEDLSATGDVLTDLLGKLEKHNGDGGALLDDLNDAGGLLSQTGTRLEGLLDGLEALDAASNAYDPQLHGALEQVKVLSQDTQAALNGASQFLGTAERFLKQNGTGLDRATEQSLSALAGALRQATRGMDSTESARNTKDGLRDLIDEKWNDYTGDLNNLLLIDTNAPAVSMTDSRNPAPGSVQYVMRTQEIRVKEAEEDTAVAAQQKDARSLWQRIADLFVGIWQDFIGLFQKK